MMVVECDCPISCNSHLCYGITCTRYIHVYPCKQSTQWKLNIFVISPARPTWDKISPTGNENFLQLNTEGRFLPSLWIMTIRFVAILFVHDKVNKRSKSLNLLLFKTVNTIAATRPGQSSLPITNPSPFKFALKFSASGQVRWCSAVYWNGVKLVGFSSTSTIGKICLIAAKFWRGFSNLWIVPWQISTGMPNRYKTL